MAILRLLHKQRTEKMTILLHTCTSNHQHETPTCNTIREISLKLRIMML